MKSNQETEPHCNRILRKGWSDTHMVVKKGTCVSCIVDGESLILLNYCEQLNHGRWVGEWEEKKRIHSLSPHDSSSSNNKLDHSSGNRQVQKKIPNSNHKRKVICTSSVLFSLSWNFVCSCYRRGRSGSRDRPCLPWWTTFQLWLFSSCSSENPTKRLDMGWLWGQYRVRIPICWNIYRCAGKGESLRKDK